MKIGFFFFFKYCSRDDRNLIERRKSGYRARHSLCNTDSVYSDLVGILLESSGCIPAIGTGGMNRWKNWPATGVRGVGCLLIKSWLIRFVRTGKNCPGLKELFGERVREFGAGKEI